MAQHTLALGERGEIKTTPFKRDEAGRWQPNVDGSGRPKARGAEKWRARCYFRGLDGMRKEVVRSAPTKREAEKSIEDAFAEMLAGSVELRAGMPLAEAGEVWLNRIGRSDSGLSARTIGSYGATWNRYVIPHAGRPQVSEVRGLTLAQANNPQRLRRFLQAVADRSGTESARQTRSVLAGVLRMAQRDGVLQTYGLDGVQPPRAQGEPTSQRRRPNPDRDTRRAFTREERNAVIAYADALAAEPTNRPTTTRKRWAVADLAAFMAGTGVRIGEARAVRWEDVDLTRAYVQVHGTKSASARRRLDLPAWLVERLTARAARAHADDIGTEGFVFAGPHFLSDGTEWQQSNCSNAIKDLLRGAGYPWATPHTFRRTVATLAHEGGTPIVHIADHLGHRTPRITMETYIGRDPLGDRSHLAALL